MEITYYHPMAAKEGVVARPELRELHNWPKDNAGCCQILIDYLKDTTETSWLMYRVRSQDHQRHCALSHAYALAGNTGWGIMENLLGGDWGTFAINDGKDPDYPEDRFPTPKSRIIAALKDVQSGKRPDLYQMMANDFEKRPQ